MNDKLKVEIKDRVEIKVSLFWPSFWLFAILVQLGYIGGLLEKLLKR